MPRRIVVFVADCLRHYVKNITLSRLSSLVIGISCYSMVTYGGGTCPVCGAGPSLYLWWWDLGALFVFMVMRFLFFRSRKTSSSEFPSLLSKNSCLAQHVHSCLWMLHLRHGCGFVALSAPRGQSCLDPLCSGGIFILPLAVKTTSSEFPSSLSENS